jgi:hypothetical protein
MDISNCKRKKGGGGVKWALSFLMWYLETRGKEGGRNDVGELTD